MNDTPAVEEIVPLNLKAILDWCDQHRPDLRPVVWAERNNNAFIMLMTVGFEAGRHFQKDRPDFPLDEKASPLYVEQASPVLRPEKKEPTDDEVEAVACKILDCQPEDMWKYEPLIRNTARRAAFWHLGQQ